MLPVPVLYSPPSQEVQLVAPAEEYDPCGHSEQTVLLEVSKRPAAQIVQVPPDELMYPFAQPTQPVLAPFAC